MSGVVGRNSEMQQCVNKVVPGTTSCPANGGVANRQYIEIHNMGLYRIRKFQQQITEFKAHSQMRSLDDELAIQRMILEEILNQCESANDLILYSTKIGEVIQDIKALVVASEKMASRTGMLVSRTEAILLAQRMVEVIARHVVDDVALAKIAEEIALIVTTPTPEDMEDVSKKRFG